MKNILKALLPSFMALIAIILIVLLMFTNLREFGNANLSLVCNVIFSIILIIYGFISIKFPPIFVNNPNINLGGYTSKRAKMDIKHWYKAQELSGKYFIRIGIIFMLLDIIIVFLNFEILKYLMILKFLIFGIGSIIYVETNLKRIFKEDTFKKTT